ncbi:MAG: tRNA epoxyqueuosine(34) reductase QueG [Brucellaceae bacterium]|nr:tRNA epoxyqueuosine(34) reductase QueG [Brucellaceae bacterium]
MARVGEGRTADAMRRFLLDEARDKGFCAVGIAAADGATEAGSRLMTAIGDGHMATMDWMAETAERRADPRTLWPDARSVIAFAMNYGPEHDPLAVLETPDRAAISVYAQNRDYHDVMKGRLKEIAQRFAARFGADVKVFVDTAPVMEKPLAARAGIGWQGKHTNLVSREHGSWLFLGEIFTDTELEPDEPERDNCGSCRACLDICPTDAFPAPYRLDARRCISYLTIEHKGPIPHAFRKAVGNRIYGCDDCLAVCPWNKFAAAAGEAKLKARADLREPPLADLLKLDDSAFRTLFAGSPIKRIGRDRFVRNVLIAAGNSESFALTIEIEGLLNDPVPIVRGAAVWALSQLEGAAAFAQRRQQAIAHEADSYVRGEWAGETS